MSADIGRARVVAQVVKEKNASIRSMEEEVRLLKRELDAIGVEARKEVHAIYSHEVQVHVSVNRGPWGGFFDVPPGKECVVIKGTLLNKEDYDDIMRLFGSLMNRPEDHFSSVTYWRTDEGILTHCGGGHLVLREPVLMSDDEWEDLKKGNVNKYMR
jgi:hypothetical protein